MRKNLLLVMALLCHLTQAQNFFPTTRLESESKGGGGGDTSEIRFDEIRSDILKWIQMGGSADLILPSGILLQDYNKKMIKFLQPKFVVVSFIDRDHPANPELQVNVDGKPKTCRSFFADSDKRPNILCNIERFKAASESEQYKLVHHEYAGLSYLEKNDGAASDYEISRQLTSYLVPETTLKLALKRKLDISISPFYKVNITLYRGNIDQTTWRHTARALDFVKNRNNWFPRPGNEFSCYTPRISWGKLRAENLENDPIKQENLPPFFWVPTVGGDSYFFTDLSYTDNCKNNPMIRTERADDNLVELSLRIPKYIVDDVAGDIRVKLNIYHDGSQRNSKDEASINLTNAILQKAIKGKTIEKYQTLDADFKGLTDISYYFVAGDKFFMNSPDFSNPHVLRSFKYSQFLAPLEKEYSLSEGRIANPVIGVSVKDSEEKLDCSSENVKLAKDFYSYLHGGFDRLTVDEVREFNESWFSSKTFYSVQRDKYYNDLYDGENSSHLFQVKNRLTVKGSEYENGIYNYAIGKFASEACF